MTTILDGKATAAELRREVATQVSALLKAGGRPPGLVAVLVGEDPASQIYVGAKMRASEEVGIVSQTIRFPESVSADELFATVDRLNRDDAVDGYLVQLPLPRGLPEREILERIDSTKDADGFHPMNVGRLWLDQEGFVPATPSGIIELLHRYDIPLAGKHAVIVGRSKIVGKPMAALLLRENATVTVCHSRTKDLDSVCRGADLLVAAVGRAGIISENHVTPGTVVVDVGMNRVSDPAEVERLFPGDEKRREQLGRKGSVLTGDVDFVRVAPRASFITPVPGGVGPLTVAMLMVNTLRASRRRQGL